MKKIVWCAFTVALLLALGPGVARATVLTFDDLPNPTPGEPSYPAGAIPNGYGGFNWGNFWHLSGVSQFPGSGYYAGLRRTFSWRHSLLGVR